MNKLHRVLVGAVLLFALTLVLSAQTSTISIQSLHSASADDLSVMLETIGETTPLPAESVPSSGTFWSVQHPYWPPMPGNINNLPVWDLGSGVYLLADQDFDYVALEQQNMTLNLLARESGLEADSDAGAGYSGYTVPTNGLWLQIMGVSNSVAWFNLYNATDQVYAIWSTTNLLASWNVETEVWPTNPVVMPFTVLTLERQNLFVQAEDWTGVTENGNTTPDWWFWEYFGTVALSDTNLDSQGNTLPLSLIVNNEGGWGFNIYYSTYSVAQANQIPNSQLQTNSFFESFDDSTLYDPNAGSAEAAKASVREKVLSDGIPALSNPAGGNSLGINFGVPNADRNMNGYKGLYRDGLWPDEFDRWRHSDIVNVAYPFNHAVFIQIITDGGLK
jgi:hypothetical protein